MQDSISCCGVDCSACRYHPAECPGCAAIGGRVFWLQYTGEPVCEIYNCCVLQKGLPHCGRCAQLPCGRYGGDDPTKTREENDGDHRAQLENLGLLREREAGIDLVRADGAHPDFGALSGELDVLLAAIVGEEEYRVTFQPHNTLEELHTVQLAYRGKQPVACAGIRRAGPTTAELKRVFVRPGCRGQGIAGRLIARLEEEALSQGYTRMVLETGEPLQEAMRLYQRLGYRRIPSYGPYGETDDSVCMEKTLGARMRSGEPPLKRIEVAAAIFQNERDEILICRRGPGGNCAFLWEFPGGKREPGESFEDCLTRECREELEVAAEPGPLFLRTDYDYPYLSVLLLFFRAKILSGSLKMDVHSAMRWAPRASLDQYEFCPADRDVVEKLMRERASAV